VCCLQTDFFLRWVRFQVLTSASVKMTVFWDVVQCSPVEIDGRFRGQFLRYFAAHSRRQSSSLRVVFQKYFITFLFSKTYHSFCSFRHRTGHTRFFLPVISLGAQSLKIGGTFVGTQSQTQSRCTIGCSARRKSFAPWLFRRNTARKAYELPSHCSIPGEGNHEFVLLVVWNLDGRQQQVICVICSATW
jgi:hypothetical protein